MTRDLERRRLKRALAKLDGRTRAVFLMSAVEGLSHEQIAGRLGLSTEDVERRLADALCQLDKRMERGERPWWRFWR